MQSFSEIIFGFWQVEKIPSDLMEEGVDPLILPWIYHWKFPSPPSPQHTHERNIGDIHQLSDPLTNLTFWWIEEKRFTQVAISILMLLTQKYLKLFS